MHTTIIMFFFYSFIYIEQNVTEFTTSNTIQIALSNILHM